MREIGWKKRLAIVLSLLWVIIAILISADAQSNGLIVFIVIGILPLAVPWGIAWVWGGFRKHQPQSTSNPQNDNGNSHIDSNAAGAVSENIPPSQPSAKQHQNKWLAKAFVATALVGFALYAGLLIRAVIHDGNIAYAIGALLIPSGVAYLALSKRREAYKTTVALIGVTTISTIVVIGGMHEWNKIVAANKLAAVMQQHLNNMNTLTQDSDTSTNSLASNQTSRQSPSPTAHPLPPRSLSENEMLEFMTTLMQEASQRQSQKTKENLAKLNQIGLEKIWEPANLISATGIRDSQHKIVTYQALLTQMEADDNAERKWQTEKVLSGAGPNALTSFRQGQAESEAASKKIRQLQRTSATNYSEILSFFEHQVKQGTVAVRDGMFMFSNQSDLEMFQSLTRRVAEIEKQEADLQKSELNRRQNLIEKMKK